MSAVRYEGEHGIVIRHEYEYVDHRALDERRTGRSSAKCACDWTTSGDTEDVRRECQLHIGLSADEREDAEVSEEAEAAVAFTLDILAQAESLAKEVMDRRGHTVTKYMAVRARMLHRSCSGAAEAVYELAGEVPAHG